MSKIKLAIPFHLDYELNDKVSEFNVLFDCNYNRLTKMLEFLETYKDKRVNIQFINYKEEIVCSICAAKPNTYVRLMSDQIREAENLTKRGVKFFFDKEISAYNVTSLNFLIEQDVTDVYLQDDLWYNLPAVRAYCTEKDVRIRLVLNKIPSSSPNRGTDIKGPIFSPIDMDILEKYVDVFEFDLGDKPNWGLCNVLYRNWFERHKWFGQLREINDEVKIDWPCSSYLPLLLESKIACQRRCDWRIDNKCNKCEQFLDIAKSLDDRNIKIKLEK